MNIARRKPDMFGGLRDAALRADLNVVPLEAAHCRCSDRTERELIRLQTRSIRLRMRIELREPTTMKLNLHVNSERLGVRRMKINDGCFESYRDVRMPLGKALHLRMRHGIR